MILGRFFVCYLFDKFADLFDVLTELNHIFVLRGYINVFLAFPQSKI